MTRTALRAATALLLGPTLAAAQRAEPAMIPTVLARTLLGSFGQMLGSDPRFTLELPLGWPASLLPRRPATTVGGVAIGPMSVAVFRFPRGADGVASVERMLLDAGYTRDTLPPLVHGGFVNATLPPTMDYCRGASRASITRDSSQRAPTVRVMLIDGAGLQSPCQPPPHASAFEMVPLEIPPLRPPRGGEAQPLGYETRTGAIDLSVRLDTLVSADSVVTHYDTQLQHAGWRLIGSGVHTARVASQEVSATDRTGHPWRGTLVAWFVDASQHVHLAMESVRE